MNQINIRIAKIIVTQPQFSHCRAFVQDVDYSAPTYFVAIQDELKQYVCIKL